LDWFRQDHRIGIGRVSVTAMIRGMSAMIYWIWVECNSCQNKDLMQIRTSVQILERVAVIARHEGLLRGRDISADPKIRDEVCLALHILQNSKREQIWRLPSRDKERGKLSVERIDQSQILPGPLVGHK
jgi:hypothetical protein